MSDAPSGQFCARTFWWINALLSGPSEKKPWDGHFGASRLTFVLMRG